MLLLIVYEVVSALAVYDSVTPPRVLVMMYPMIGLPPFEVGAVQLTVA